MAFYGEFEIFQPLFPLVLVFICFGLYALRKKQKLNLPPGPRGLPIVGILPFLGKNPHLELCKLSQKYGDIFSIYLGRTYAVVVTDVAMAKELLSKSCTADRPPDLFQMMPGGIGIGELNGAEWSEQRRYSMMQLRNLGLGKSHWENLVQMEVSDTIESISNSPGKPVDIKGLLSAGVSNNIVSLLTNQRLPVGDPKRDIIDHGVESFQRLHTQSGLMIYFPKLFKLAVDFGLLNVEDKLKNVWNMYKFVSKVVAESKENKEGESYIDKYMTEIEKNKTLKLRNSFNEINLIGNVQVFLIGGTDTTYISVFWLLLAMASFPDIQERVHEELDNVLGKDGSVDWVERNKLPYCMATIMEGQRWRTVAPLNVLHRTNEDMVINGYDIPKGTNLITHLWAFHHDPKYWEDPDLFYPGRFLSSDGKAIKMQEAYLPFSFGKRICPGKTVAYIEIFHFFVRIMQKFQVLPESEASLPDLEGFLGLTLQPKSQPLRFIAR